MSDATLKYKQYILEEYKHGNREELSSVYFEANFSWHVPALEIIEVVITCGVIVFAEIDHIVKFQFQYELHIRCIVGIPS